MAAALIDGKKIAQEIRSDVARRVALLADRGLHPGLTVVYVGDDAGSAVYVRNKERAAREAGIRSETVRLPAETSESELLARLEALNRDPAVHGYIVQLPVPKQIDPNVVLAAVDPAKDVDGFHPVNQGRLLTGQPLFIPATARGVQELLLRSGIPISGRHVAIVGRSNIVGRPLAALLLGKGEGGDATVTVCHSKTRDLASITRTADIVVAAIGQPEFIRAAHVKPGAVVIDVGMNRLPDNRLVGDVAFAEVAPVASAITPVPGGVGPMTIAMLLLATVEAAERSADRSVHRPAKSGR
ncbi:MAG: bifunctional 5,10-methylenetetrahydrofolate dehydrogenase/5,10-methenyltetrahydrofolate cyclohydrolase [Thermoplasmatota archaeon]